MGAHSATLFGSPTAYGDRDRGGLAISHTRAFARHDDARREGGAPCRGVLRREDPLRVRGRARTRVLRRAVDVNVFVDADGTGAVLDLLAPFGVDVRKRETLVRIRRDGQVRLIWDETPLDLFFAHDPFHASVAERVRDVPFADQTINILSPEDLVVFKTAFGRRKDWIDIEQVVFTTAGDFDLTYALSWAERIVGAEDRRLAALREAIERILGEGATG